MPATSIALGTGRLPGNHAKGETLEVHLHLNCPATPISLGVRWGTQSTGAGLTLQDATAYCEEEHLRACGCDWLRQVANEERLSGRIFTPEEILQRQPGSADILATATGVANSIAATATAGSSATLGTIREALAHQDYEEIESLRDILNPELVRLVAADWRANSSWDIKDAYAALLLDQTADCVRPIFLDALHSPTVETRAYAVCVLTRDFGRFDAMMVNGGLDEARVDAAVVGLGSQAF